MACFYAWPDAYIHFPTADFRRADALFGGFCTILFFKHLERQKIQGTYFKISALYFKIYGLYFLRHGLCFFSCAHFASRITLLRVCLCANKWKYSAYGLGKSENVFRKNCNKKPAAAYNVCKGACAAPHAKDA